MLTQHNQESDVRPSLPLGGWGLGTRLGTRLEANVRGGGLWSLRLLYVIVTRRSSPALRGSFQVSEGTSCSSREPRHKTTRMKYERTSSACICDDDVKWA